VTITTVIFDLDGTLVSFNIDYRTVRAEVRSFLIGTGVPAAILACDESIFEMLKKTEIFMKNFNRPEEEFEEIRRQALAIAEKYELNAAERTKLLPGVIETLKNVKKMNLKIGLCTINSEKSTSHILKRFGMTEFFDAVITRNDVRYVKPNPEHLEAALKALGAVAEETIVIGDGGIDMKCAAELKTIAVGLPTGVSSTEHLISQGANYIITSIADLPTLIAKINDLKSEK
jgi:HAD superfamily hydrolase (TIGR01509 family)